jgi:hypothetical protein
MAALAADRQTRYRAQEARHRRCGVAAATTIYKGAIVCKNAAGYLVPGSDTAALTCVGIAEEQVVNAGAAGALDCGYATGMDVELVNSAGTIVQASQKAYAADDQSVNPTGTSVHHVLVGTVTEFTATLVWVYVDEQSSVAGA